MTRFYDRKLTVKRAESLGTNADFFTNLRGYDGYGTLPIPQALDSEITELLRQWEGLGELERDTAVRQLQSDQRWTFLAYSERMASLAVRESNASLIHCVLLAIGIGWGLGDCRDSVLILPLHYDAATRIGIGPEEMFERAASYLPTEPGNVLRRFPQRSNEDKSLAAMGYVVGSDSDGFRYQRTW
jgi:hypothetical protein